MRRKLEWGELMKGLDEVLGFHGQALNLRAYRQQLLASNIANADTPNFKARDIDFKAALQGALKTDNPQPGKLSVTSPNHMPASTAPAPAGAALLYRTPTQASIDGNTVDMDQERAAFADNALHYEANILFLNSQIRAMYSAIQGN